jgi:hypothetical protein
VKIWPPSPWSYNTKKEGSSQVRVSTSKEAPEERACLPGEVGVREEGKLKGLAQISDQSLKTQDVRLG